MNMNFACVCNIECLRPSSPSVSYAVTIAPDCERVPESRDISKRAS
jgi:hypothetical protein